MSAEAFARVPLWILGRSDVSWAGKILYGLISRYVGKGRTAWPSIAALAGDMRTSDRNVRAWLQELRQAGLIDIERTGRASTYRLLGEAPDEPPEGAVITVPERQEAADQERQASAEQSGNVLPISPAETCRSDAPAPLSREEIIEKKREESAASAPRPLEVRGDDLERAHRLLVKLYTNRYEQRTEELTGNRDPWLGWDKAHREIRAAARWVVHEGPARIDARAAELVDGMFDPARDRFQDARWPWSWVARDPAEFARPPVERGGNGRREGFLRVPPPPEQGAAPTGDIPEEFMKKGRVIGYG